jgi:apoptosis-inducing factor 2
VERAVKARGIDIITSDYVDTIPEGNVTSTGVVTRSGKHVDADLVVATRGAKPVTEFLTGSGLSLSQSGFVKAELTLQAKGFSNIFIAGDILDFDEQKQIAKVGTSRTVEYLCMMSHISPHIVPSTRKCYCFQPHFRLGRQGGCYQIQKADRDGPDHPRKA